MSIQDKGITFVRNGLSKQKRQDRLYLKYVIKLLTDGF